MNVPGWCRRLRGELGSSQDSPSRGGVQGGLDPFSCPDLSRHACAVRVKYGVLREAAISGHEGAGHLQRCRSPSSDMRGGLRGGGRGG